MNHLEITSGLAVVSSIPEKYQAIVTEFSVTYKKKARGTLRGQCDFKLVFENVEKEYTVISVLTDESGSEVAVGEATWKVRPF